MVSEKTFDEPTPKCFHCGQDPYSFNYQTDKMLLEHWKDAVDFVDFSLELAYNHWGNRETPIRREVLEGLQIELSMASLEKNEKTGKEVYWFNFYGLQKVNEEQTHFMILCRKSM